MPINGKDYTNVTVELKTAGLVDLVVGVKVIVTDNREVKKIYQKRFSQSYLYAFSDGTLQVGKGNALTQISLYKSNGYWTILIKEKGIY